MYGDLMDYMFAHVWVNSIGQDIMCARLCRVFASQELVQCVKYSRCKCIGTVKMPAPGFEWWPRDCAGRAEVL